MSNNIFIAAVPSYDHKQLIMQRILNCETKRSSQLRIDWTNLADLHITLGFLPSVDPADFQAIAQSFAVLTQSTKFISQVKDVRIFGNAIVLRLEPLQNFLVLYRKLKHQLQEVLTGKYAFKEHGRFEAHLTVGRIKSPRVLTHMQKAQLITTVSEQFVNTTFLVQQASLMQRIPETFSSKAKSSQVYQVLQGYPFK